MERPDIAVVYTPVGGGHRAAAFAVAEAARARGLRVELLDLFALASPLVGVVTDYTAHACGAEPGVDAFCAPCRLAEIELVEHGIPRERVMRTGIPIREAFESIPRVREPERGEAMRVLVTMGGF